MRIELVKTLSITYAIVIQTSHIEVTFMGRKKPLFLAEEGRHINMGMTPLFGNPANCHCSPVALRPQVTLGLPFRRSCESLKYCITYDMGCQWKTTGRVGFHTFQSGDFWSSITIFRQLMFISIKESLIASYISADSWLFSQCGTQSVRVLRFSLLLGDGVVRPRHLYSYLVLLFSIFFDF